jgi:hypothetical protein
MQRQQYRLSENHGIRERHRELIKMTFDDPSLKPCWGESSGTSGLTENEAAYCNLIIDHWHMLWQIERIDLVELKRMAGSFFNGEIGRQYWTAFGNPWMTPSNRRTERFQETFDIELERAVSNGPPSVRRASGDDEAARVAERARHAMKGRPSRNSKTGKGRLIAAAVAGASAALIVDQSIRGKWRIR